MGRPGLSVFTITLEQDEVNVKGVLTVLCRDVIQLLDMIRDVINEPFACLLLLVTTAALELV